jgi:hypothetical protein
LWICLFFITISLGYFGAPTRKDIIIWSNFDIIYELPEYYSRRSLPRAETPTAVETYDKFGAKHVVGTEKLKETQEYPDDFGEALARIYMKHSNMIKRVAEQRATYMRAMPTVDMFQRLIDIVSYGEAGDLWVDACIEDVFARLQDLCIQRL